MARRPHWEFELIGERYRDTRHREEYILRLEEELRSRGGLNPRGLRAERRHTEIHWIPLRLAGLVA